MKYLFGFLIGLISIVSNAEPIAFGNIVAIKQYDMGSDKSIKIYLDSSSTHTNSMCAENGRFYGTITHSDHEEQTINRMFSLVTAALMAGKKIRLHSTSNSCEVDFVAIQDAVF